MTARVAAPRARKSFSRLKHVLELPNLIDIQKASFQWFLDEGLRETIDDISPIEDYTGTLAVEFGDYKFGEPPISIKECREKDLTYQAPLSISVDAQKTRFVKNDQQAKLTDLAANDNVVVLSKACREDLRAGATSGQLPALTARMVVDQGAPGTEPPPSGD